MGTFQLKDKTEIPPIIDINIMMNKFLFLVLVTVVVAAPTTTIQANAQTTPPPLEESNKPLLPTVADKEEKEEEPTSTTPSLGKITIQISQTEQIVLDLPLKSDNTYQVVPIK